MSKSSDWRNGYDIIGRQLEQEMNHMRMLQDMNKHGEIETNAKGGKQSKIGRLYTSFPEVMMQVARVLYNGKVKYGSGNDLLIPDTEHINHALNHIYHWLSGDTTEDHLTHAICRLILAKNQQYP